MKFKTLSVIAGIAIASHTNAAVTYTYIDATPNTGPATGNTTLDGAVLVDGTNYVDGTGTTTDDFWSYRATPAYAAGSYFESDGSTSTDESTGNLVTTFSPGAIGTYDVIVLFDNNSGQDVAAKIGVPPSASDIFINSNSVDAADLTLSANYNNTRSQMRAGFLQQVTTTTVGQTIEVFVNGLEPSGATSVNRTQYDGVAFALVPAPSTSLLGAFGALALLRRRRK